MGFWGLLLEEGKFYSQKVTKPFHISMAALEPTEKGSNTVTVNLEQDGNDFILCTLKDNSICNVALDLNFSDDDEVKFFLNGKGTVHLTGYVIADDDMSYEESDSEDDVETPFISEVKEKPGKKEAVKSKAAGPKITLPDSDDESEDDSDEDDSEDDSEPEKPEPAAEKKKKEVAKPEKKKEETTKSKKEEKKKVEAPAKKLTPKDDSDESDSDDDDDSDSDSPIDFKKLMAEASDGSDEEEDDDDFDMEEMDEDEGEEGENEEESDEDDDDSSEESPPKKAKKPSTPVPQPKKGKENKTPVSTPKTDSKKDKKEQEPASGKKRKAEEASTPLVNGHSESSKKKKKEEKKGGESPKTPKKMIKGEIEVLDLVTGSGPEAVAGKNVSVYYEGRLKSTNKKFDSKTDGKGFKFKLGANEVIKGWDSGLAGMKVGGKRRLTIPPKMAYGDKGAPPEIPPKSDLVFEIELKSVS